MAYTAATWLTAPAGTSDGSDAQNDPDASLGLWRSSTAVSLTIGNLWTQLTLAQLVGSTTYRCVVLTNTSGTETLEQCRTMTDSVTLATGMSVEFGVGAFDSITSSISTANETTAPVGPLFSAPYQATGVSSTDWSSAEQIGPVNGWLNTGDVTATDDTRIFLFIKLICLNVDASTFDGTNNKIGIQVVGTDGV